MLIPESLIKSGIKILGVTVCKSKSETISVNYDPVLQSIKGTLDLWLRRKLVRLQRGN